MHNKILCGLDIGTNSVGWCLTDENNKIIRKQGKTLWGVRMFEEASSCVERRTYRSNRRRLNRRRERIELLRILFAQEVNKIDPTFFERLDNSFYQKEDRSVDFNYTLFNDLNYTDKTFYKQYPTIYHLRKGLINDDKKHDIRLIYLALHHMIKYRGNFLNNSEEFKPMDANEVADYFDLLINVLPNYLDGETIRYDSNIFMKLEELNKGKVTVSFLKEKINEIINPDGNKYIKDVIVPLISGGKVATKKLNLDEIDELDFKDICVKDEKYDEHIESLLSFNKDKEELINCFISCKNIYQFFLLGRLLDDSKYLSDAMVKKYDLHHKQLVEFKKYVKINFPNKYNLLFRDVLKDKDKKKNCNYVKYIGSNVVDGVKTTFGHCTAEEFYNFIKDNLNLKGFKVAEVNKNTYEAKIIELMNGENFLPRQNSVDNSVFPYQLNLMEMKIILNNQSKYHSFLLDKDEEGLTLIDKIISILKYKIPYYVGPLISPNEENERSKFSWIVRMEEKIYPWNYDKVINMDETAKNFIYKMLNKCSYLPSNYCLPKNSLIFSYFNVLQVLNKTLINGGIIPKKDKLEIIHNLFMRVRKVTKKDFVNYLKSRYGEDVIVSTSNNKEIEEFSCNMASYVDFTNIFGEEYVSKNVDKIEKIIRDLVVFEDKSIFEKRLTKEYGIIDKAIIKKIKGLTYTKYASISKELLTDIHCFNEETEESLSIIKIMENTNQNLQEIIYDEKYGFETRIYNYNVARSSKGDYESIEEYVQDLGAISPGMKRPLIQAYKICEELEKIVGQPIDEYYVECTRSNKEKKVRKSSRYEMMKSLYLEASKILKDDMEFNMVHKKLLEIEADKFQSDKYYLYFTQMGKCMYSGEPIDIEDLNDTSKYDIDHIIPRSMIKDDSFTNRVLVKQEFNKRKKDSYPIPQSILFEGKYNAAYKFYEKLKDNKLITNEKFHRLTTRELSETDLASFVNRQLVNTNQAVKGFINAIKFFKTTDDFKPKIVYSKGENVSDFRHAFDIVKSREANNFHHAHDAYLNIVVGRAIDTHFAPYSQNQYTLKWMHENGLTTNPLNIFFQNKKESKENIIDSKGNLVWDYDNSIKTVKKNIYNRHDILTTTRTYIGNNFLEKVTIYPRGEGNISVNNKLSAEKYGGYTGYSFGSYALIKKDNKFILEAIPTMKRSRVKEYLEKECKYKDFEIIVDNIKTNTIIETENRKFAITGKQNDGYLLMNKMERCFSEKQIKVLKKIEKLIEKLTRLKVKITGEESLEDISKIGFYCDNDKIIISPAANDKTHAVELSNEELIEMYNFYIFLYQKDIYSFSACKNIAISLIESKDKFLSLSILGKAKIIINLNDLLKCNERKTADLSLLRLKSNVGVLYLGKTLSNCKIIYESITGFYRKVIFEIE